MHSPFLATRRLVVYAILTLLMIPVQLTLLMTGSRWAPRLPIRYHRTICRVLGIAVETRGTMSAALPTLFVSNHSSYIDIEILGSLIEGSFIAKKEVESWPFFGLLAKLQRTVFVERRPNRARQQRDDLNERLAGGENLILFPEGTSNDGNRTYPFKSALFSVAAFEKDGVPLVVQPVSVAYTHLDGIPLGRALRPFFAWYGDMDLAPHLWHLAGLGRLTASVEFHAPVSLADFDSRKALAEHCQRAVAGGVTAAIYGRAPALREAA